MSVNDVFYIDNPGGRWLESKQAFAEEAANFANRGSATEKGFIGSITASTRHPVWLPVDALKYIPGAMNERPCPGNGKYDELAKSVEENGWDHDQDGNAVYLAINQHGQPFMMEGNHRLKIAQREGVDVIKAEVKYWNGGENYAGSLSPEAVVNLMEDAPEANPQMRP